MTEWDIVRKKVSWVLIIALLLTGTGLKGISLSFDVLANTNTENEILDRDFELFGGSGGSRQSGENQIISSTFEFSSPNNNGMEGHARFYYTDDFFKDNASVYNSHLNTTSVELAMAGVGNHMDSPRDKYGNLKDFMSKMGFKNITPNEDFLREPETDTMGAVCANKPIYLKNAVGSVIKYNLIVTAMRSANYESEWESNFKLGESGDHQGFSESRDIIYDHLTTFYNEHKDDFGAGLPIKYWIVGYSRGAAVSNMLAGKLVDNAAAFNTTKENIYCYTFGTPKGALISNHTTPALDTYTNIHNLVSPADPLQMFVPETVGFGRYGIDHEVPCKVSDKVHDDTERAAREASNVNYMTKYNQMMEYYTKIDPPAELNINNFDVWKLVLFDFSTFQYLLFDDLSLNPFTDTSPETDYYQAKEFLQTFINKFLVEEAFSCAYAGIDYAGMVGRERYYNKYQDLIRWAVKKAMVDDLNPMINKVVENAKDNLLSLLSLLGALQELVYTADGVAPADRTNYQIGGSGSYYNIYNVLEPIYRTLLDGAVSTEELDFLMSHHRDITDLLLDVLNTDYRTINLSKQTAIGSLVKNANIWKELHKDDVYLAWAQREDDYYTNPPVDTVNIDGNKSVIFTSLSDSLINIYDEQNNYIGTYTIDATNNVEFTSGLDDEYVNVVKSYNPVGMELRVPSGLKYRAEVIATDSSIGEVIYKEYFSNDSQFYRKEKALGSVYLNSGESYIIDFNKSYMQTVFSCYPYDTATAYQKARMAIATINDVEYISGNDYYSFASEPDIYKIQRQIDTLASISAATNSNINIDEVIYNATESELDEIVDIATESELIENDFEASPSEVQESIGETIGIETENSSETETSETEIDETESSEIETNESDSSELESSEIETSETEIDETDTIIESEESEESIESEEEEEEEESVVVSGFSSTETIYSDAGQSTVVFENEASAAIYYFDGTNYVRTRSGNTFPKGTKIKITAPFRSGENVFYGWTLTNSAGTILNQRGIDTLRIEDQSTSLESTYVIELKDYDMNIKANFTISNYTLSLEIDDTKGTLDPADTLLTYDTLATFENVKDNVSIVAKSEFKEIYWYDGTDRYDKLSDYYWSYSSNVTLKVIFVEKDPEPEPAPDPGDDDDDDDGGGEYYPSGGGSSGGRGGSNVIPDIQRAIDSQSPTTTTNTQATKAATQMASTEMTAWRLDPVTNRWKLNLSMTNDQVQEAKNGFYSIVTLSTTIINNVVLQTPIVNTYFFNENGDMCTGWVKTADNKIYFFENAKTLDEGKLVTGWRNISGY